MTQHRLKLLDLRCYMSMGLRYLRYMHQLCFRPVFRRTASVQLVKNQYNLLLKLQEDRLYTIYLVPMLCAGTPGEK